MVKVALGGLFLKSIHAYVCICDCLFENKEVVVMPSYDELIVGVLFFSVMLLEYAAGVFEHKRRLQKEWWVDALAFIHLASIKPLVLLAGFAIGAFLFPELNDSLSELPFWLAFLWVFIPDDFFHYWIHRIAHVTPALWPMHRTHHTATVYQTSIAFRENWSWFVVLPGFWWQGVMVYFGLLEEVLLANVVIGVHNIWLHAGAGWSPALYKKPVFGKWVQALEYFITTPGMHRAHHGLGKGGVPYGNYSQTLSVWDWMFGTAVYTQGEIPEYYAVHNKEIMAQPWYYHLWWPFVKKDSVACCFNH